MAEQLTREQRKALYNARKGKKQRLQSRLVFQSTTTTVQKGKGDKEGQLLRTRRTASAIRGERNQYEATQHTPVMSVSEIKKQ